MSLDIQYSVQCSSISVTLTTLMAWYCLACCSTPTCTVQYSTVQYSAVLPGPLQHPHLVPLLGHGVQLQNRVKDGGAVISSCV